MEQKTHNTLDLGWMHDEPIDSWFVVIQKTEYTEMHLVKYQLRIGEIQQMTSQPTYGKKIKLYLWHYPKSSPAYKLRYDDRSAKTSLDLDNVTSELATFDETFRHRVHSYDLHALSHYAEYAIRHLPNYHVTKMDCSVDEMTGYIDFDPTEVHDTYDNMVRVEYTLYATSREEAAQKALAPKRTDVFAECVHLGDSYHNTVYAVYVDKTDTYPKPLCIGYCTVLAFNPYP